MTKIRKIVLTTELQITTTNGIFQDRNLHIPTKQPKSSHYKSLNFQLTDFVGNFINIIATCRFCFVSLKSRIDSYICFNFASKATCAFLLCVLLQLGNKL